ncbi:MAG: phosphatidate cytidylyltransferase [Gammaproteobacteria bacterium]|nr:phosphatidate cytidylyltransferase [Gammaproteobacteria bacterium]
MLKLRLATAFVLAPAVLAGVVFLPNHLFAAFVFLLGAFGLYEWAGLTGIANATNRIAYVCLAGLCMYALWLQSEWRMAVLVATSVFWLFACLFVLLMASGSVGRRGSGRGNGDPLPGTRMRLTLMAPGGILIFAGAWLGLVLLHASQDGHWLIVWAFALAWSVDTGAYFVGRAWGRNRLAPGVSPGKTWEGVAGGMCAGLAAGCGLAWALGLGSLPEWAVVAVALSVVAVFGDLFESAIKRTSGAKDSGTILPGHGGVLDRIDSTIAVVPVFALWAAVMM